MKHRGRQPFDSKNRANSMIKPFCESINEKLATDSQLASTYNLDRLGIEFAKHLGRSHPYGRSSISAILKRNDLHWSYQGKKIIPLYEFNQTTIEGSYEILDALYHVCIKTTSHKVSNSIKDTLLKDPMISEEILTIIPFDKCVIIYSDNVNIKDMTKKRLALLLKKANE